MEIKCQICQTKPKIDILDKIQAIRFICQNNNISHYGLLSINNFYKNFLKNYTDDFSNFIEKCNINYKNNNNIYLPSIFEFIKFQNDFDSLLNELINIYEKLKNYFYKILFIKNIFETKKDTINNEIENYYYNEHIINKMKELINIIKDTILIKEEYPKIKNNNELISKINIQLNTLYNKNNLDDINKDFEYFNYKQNNCSIKNLIKFELKNDEINIIRDRKLFKLAKILEPACFI